MSERAKSDRERELRNSELPLSVGVRKRGRKEGRKGSIMDRERMLLRDKQRVVRIYIHINTTIKRPTKRLRLYF